MMRDFFKHRIDEVVGAYFDGATLFVACLRRRKSSGDVSRIVENDEVVDVDYVFEVARDVESWVLSDTVEMPFDAINADNVRAEALAEKISVVCSTHGWSTNVMALCLDRSDVVIELDDFSNIPPLELSNAVRYQLATVGNFDIDDFYAAHVELDGRTWAEGIARADVRAWLEAWRKNDMMLTGLTAMPDGLNEIEGIDPNGLEVSASMAKAIYCARSVALNEPPNFLSEEVKRSTSWDFRKFAAAVAAITLIGLSTMFGLDRWDYNKATEALKVEQTQLQALERDQRLKNFIELERKELVERRELLTALSKEIFPWRGVLIHFGAFHVEGVWLNEIRGAEDRSIEIRCEALSYEAMSRFIKALEADFRHEPEIQHSQTARGGSTVEFVVRLPML